MQSIKLDPVDSTARRSRKSANFRLLIATLIFLLCGVSLLTGGCTYLLAYRDLIQLDDELSSRNAETEYKLTEKIRTLESFHNLPSPQSNTTNSVSVLEKLIKNITEIQQQESALRDDLRKLREELNYLNDKEESNEDANEAPNSANNENAFDESHLKFLTEEKLEILMSLPEKMERNAKDIMVLEEYRIESLFSSKILSISAMLRINSYFEKRNLLPRRFKLLYRASDNQYSATAFHSKCDSKGPTLVVIRSKASSDEENTSSSVFGGFTTAQWSNKEGSAMGSKDDFLFSLDWEEDLPILDKKYGSVISHSIYNYEFAGPQFGLAPEIKLGNECQKHKESQSILGSPSRTYQEPTGATSFVKSGDSSFLCEDYEVFSVEL